MTPNKKAPSWEKLHDWFVEKLAAHDNSIQSLANGNGGLNSSVFIEPSVPKADYQIFLENASRTMIRFKKPEHLIKMIVKTIDEQLKVTHTAVLLYKEEKKSYILIDSKGAEGLKIPVGFIRLPIDNPLISVFCEKQSYLISETGILRYEDLINALRNRDILEKQPDLYDKLLLLKRQMDLIKASLCVPCYFKKDLLGILVLGEKISGDPFTREEMGFFVTLANDAAMAIANAQLIDNLHQKVEEIKGLYLREHRIFIHTSIALAAAIDARDPYTHGHTERVTNYCLAIAKELDGLPEIANYKNFRETLQIAALLHDIGKIGIPDHILNKQSRLTPEEYEEIKKHSIIGATILNPIKELSDVAREVRHHQECYDGSGYPDGLKGNGIPLIARIIAVADAFDAMTTNRAYRKGRAAEEALQELKRCSGSQFDPVIVSAFLLAYEKGNILSNGKSGYWYNSNYVDS
ncbi:MAG: HD domain-containing protein [Candidatus Omnitrophica bacterium]|nr:HD domain-containing protein [Candidatus Omnitrophota bacterium]MCM8790376.1 HD domain-containing protein [Candidatus Omnitrophota bacterium]